MDHQHQWKVNVWCGILDGEIIGPHFYENNLNRGMYLQFLQNDLHELLENTSLRIRERIFSTMVLLRTELTLCEKDILNAG